MNLQALLAARREAGKPVRVGLIGAGKFGTMFLAQVPAIPGLEVAVIADLDPDKAKAGSRSAGIVHALAAIGAGKHIVMVNVEADVLAGPLLAARAHEKGVVYSMAYGDQPALIAEMADWARSTGFIVAAAGKGTKYLPAYHAVTPDDVWPHYGLTPEQAS